MKIAKQKRPMIQERCLLFNKITMINSITNLNENLVIYVESGTARLRSKEEVSFQSLLKEKLEEHNTLIPEKADELSL